MTDAEALARFEAVALEQPPNQALWRPVTDYSFAARKVAEGTHPALIRDVFQPKSVIDAGCGKDAHLVRLLRELDVNARGFDVQIAGGKRHGIPSHLAVADLAMPVEAFPLKAIGRAELVICREVLEHLTLLDVRRAVTNLCRISTRFVYVTTRFHLAPQHVLDVMTSDDLDPDHKTMLHQDFLRALFVLEGFKRRADLEQRMDWQDKKRVLVYERAA